MRTLITACAIALIGTFTANAQEKKASPADNVWVALNTEQLNLQLGLSDDQKAKVKEIDQRFVTKHEALQEAEPKLSEKDMSDKTAALMNERDRELKAILTAEQYAKWEKMRHKGTSDLTEEKKEKMEK